MCGLIWLAGSTRYVGAAANIGFHGVYAAKTGNPTAIGNALVGAYLRDLGLSYDSIMWMVKAPAAKMDWLTSAKAEELGIVAQVIQ